jgi:hypothetical protein
LFFGGQNLDGRLIRRETKVNLPEQEHLADKCPEAPSPIDRRFVLKRLRAVPGISSLKWNKSIIFAIEDF